MNFLKRTNPSHLTTQPTTIMHQRSTKHAGQYSSTNHSQSQPNYSHTTVRKEHRSVDKVTKLPPASSYFGNYMQLGGGTSHRLIT